MASIGNTNTPQVLQNFRKGQKFSWKSLSKKGTSVPYQDPTYLSFVLLFHTNKSKQHHGGALDVSHSPLLDGTAEEWVKTMLVGGGVDKEYYERKLVALREFKKALLKINKDVPWTWQSIAGLDRVFKYDDKNPYRGGDESSINISCLESLNLSIAGLMQLYREAIWDDRKWAYLIPENLRHFEMDVYITEVRTLANKNKPTLSGVDLSGFPDNFKPSIGVNNSSSDISGSNRPYMFISFSHCTFDMKSGSDPFGSISHAAPELASNSINIKYSIINRTDGKFLNGIIEDYKPKSDINIAPDSENEEINNLADFAKKKLSDKAKDLLERTKQDIINKAKSKAQDIMTDAGDILRQHISPFENIYQGAMGALDKKPDTRVIGGNLPDNVHVVVNGTSIRETLDNAAVISLGNVYE